MAPSRIPAVLVWLSAALMWAGVLGFFTWHDRRRRTLSGVVAVVALAGSVVAFAGSPAPPGPPGYQLTLLVSGGGATVTSPVALSACGRWPGGDAAAVPGAGHLLLVLVDGRQAAEVATSSVDLPATAGRHLLGVEVITRDHLEFQPPLIAEATVAVGGVAAPPPPPACPA